MSSTSPYVVEMRDAKNFDNFGTPILSNLEDEQNYTTGIAPNASPTSYLQLHMSIKSLASFIFQKNVKRRRKKFAPNFKFIISDPYHYCIASILEFLINDQRYYYLFQVLLIIKRYEGNISPSECPNIFSYLRHLQTITERILSPF